MAIAEGTEISKPIRQLPVADMVQKLSILADHIIEIVTGSHTDDIDFVMNGVNCMSAIELCSKRLEKDQTDDDNQIGNGIRTKLSDLTNSLLKRGWPEETKLNKSNVGKMLALLLDNSCTAIPSNANAASKIELDNLGRMTTLQFLVEDVLCELPNTDKCKGPVDLFQTCTSQTFGSYFSVVLQYIQKELSSLFNSSLGKTKDPAVAKRTLAYITSLIDKLQKLFDLIKDNEVLAKKQALLQQLKWGSRFVEIFVSKGTCYSRAEIYFSIKYHLQLIFWCGCFTSHPILPHTLPAPPRSYFGDYQRHTQCNKATLSHHSPRQKSKGCKPSQRDSSFQESIGALYSQSQGIAEEKSLPISNE